MLIYGGFHFEEELVLKEPWSWVHTGLGIVYITPIRAWYHFKLDFQQGHSECKRLFIEADSILSEYHWMRIHLLQLKFQTEKGLFSLFSIVQESDYITLINHKKLGIT